MVCRGRKRDKDTRMEWSYKWARVRRRRATTLACVCLLLALVILPSATSADEGDRVALVVEFGDGRVTTRCVALETGEATGADLLTLSGLEVLVDASSGMGITVCQVEGVGCAYPVDRCFCQCMSGDTCAYWNYFFRDPGESDWSYSALGALLRKVESGSVEAWVWGDGQTPPADDLTFETICAPPTTVPTEPSPRPTAQAAPATPVPTAPKVTADTPAPEVAPTAATPTAAPVSPPGTNSILDIFGYWPLRLVVIGLVAAVAYLRLRRR
jgi:hypothetical protein